MAGYKRRRKKGKLRYFFIFLILIAGLKKMKESIPSLFAKKENREVIFSLEKEGYFVSAEGRITKAPENKSLPILEYRDSLVFGKKISQFYPCIELLKEIERHGLKLDIERVFPDSLIVQLKDGKVVIFGMGNFDSKINFLKDVFLGKSSLYDTIDLRILNFFNKLKSNLKGG